MSEQRSTIPGFDYLKIVCSTLIVFHHYQQVFNCHFPYINFFNGTFYLGWLVELFFMISGFLTVYTLRNDKSLFQFFHKIIRLYPVSVISVFIALLVKLVLNYAIHDYDMVYSLLDIKSLFANFLLIFSGYPVFAVDGYNNPLWYICILIQCYFLFYLIRLLTKKIKCPAILGELIIILLAYVLSRFLNLDAHSFRGWTTFFMGSVICEVLQSKIGIIIHSHRKIWLSVFAVILIGAMAFLIITKCSHLRNVLIFGIYPFLLFLCYELNLKQFAAVELMSKASFEVYVWHGPVMNLILLIIAIFKLNIIHTYFTMIVITILVWGLGWILFQYLELPLNGLINRKQILYRENK